MDLNLNFSMAAATILNIFVGLYEFRCYRTLFSVSISNLVRIRSKMAQGYLYSAQCKWRNAFTVSFRVRFRVRNRVPVRVRVRVRIRVRVRVRLFSPLRHLHCAEYRSHGPVMAV